MKQVEKEKAIKLRRQGLSLRSITKKVNASKSSVSIWVRSVELSTVQKERLRKNKNSQAIVEKRRATRLLNEEKKREKIIKEAEKEIKKISKKELFLIGLSLYWGEGRKKSRNIVSVSNSDPDLIKIMMKFLKDVCKVPEKKFRGHIHLHPHLDNAKAEKYWSGISGIPKNQFFKTSQQHNKSSKNKKDSLPFGTFDIYVCDTKMFLKIKGWTQGVSKSILSI